MATLKQLAAAHEAKLNDVVMALCSGALRRYLAAQVSQALFPFALWGGGLSQGMTVLGVRYATVKYALAAHGAENDDATLSAHIARLARFFDHLGDPALSLAIYTETGWVRESRLRALIGDA